MLDKLTYSLLCHAESPEVWPSNHLNTSLICLCVGNPNECSFNSFVHLFWQLHHTTFHAILLHIYTTLTIKHIKSCWVQSRSTKYGNRLVHMCKKTLLKESTWLVDAANPVPNGPISRHILFDVRQICFQRTSNIMFS